MGNWILNKGKVVNIDEIRRLASKARVIFEKHHNFISRTYFDGFPDACCGNASCLLLRYYVEKGIKNIEYVNGEKDEGTHGWIEIEGLIVDITADQFENGLERVYVSYDRDFHDSYSLLNRNPDTGINPFLSDSYDKFRDLMNES